MYSKIIKERYEFYEYTEEQLDCICEAFDSFIEPYEENWSMINPNHNKKRTKKQYTNARNIIAELLKNDGCRDEVIKSIDTAIFWASTTPNDIKKDFNERAESSLRRLFNKSETASFMKDFRDIKKDL